MARLKGKDYLDYWTTRARKTGIRSVGHHSMDADAVHKQGEDIWAFISPSLPKLAPYSTIIDYGCGWGRMTAKLADHYPDCNVIGIDFVEVNIERAKEHSQRDNATYLCAGEIPDECLNANLIFTCTVLQHVTCKDGTRAIQDSFQRCLNRGASILMFENVVRTGSRHMANRSTDDYLDMFKDVDWAVPAIKKLLGEPHALMFGRGSNPPSHDGDTPEDAFREEAEKPREDDFPGIRVAITCMDRQYTESTIKQALQRASRSGRAYHIRLFDGEGRDDYLLSHAWIQRAIDAGSVSISCTHEKRHVIRNGLDAFEWLGCGHERWGLFLQDDIQMAEGFFSALEYLADEKLGSLKFISHWHPYPDRNARVLECFKGNWSHYYGALALQGTTEVFSKAYLGMCHCRDWKGFDLLLKRGVKPQSPKIFYCYPSLVKHMGMQSSIIAGRRHDHHRARSFRDMSVEAIERAKGPDREWHRRHNPVQGV